MSGNKQKSSTDTRGDTEESGSSNKIPKEKRDQDKTTKDQHQQDLLDEAIEESFPASDSPTASRVE